MPLRRRRLGDRRTRPRFEIVGQLWGALDTVEPLTLLDLGRGGALVASRVPFPADSVQHLRFTFEGAPADVQARVRHVRAGEPNEGARYLIGLEFVSLPEEAALQIARLLASGGASEEGGLR
jgi:hypothetical protein